MLGQIEGHESEEGRTHDRLTFSEGHSGGQHVCWCVCVSGSVYLLVCLCESCHACMIMRGKEAGVSRCVKLRSDHIWVISLCQSVLFAL